MSEAKLIAEYRYSPALLLRDRKIRIYSDRVEKWHGDRREDQIAIQKIRSARYVNMTAREYRFRRLDLGRLGQKPFRIPLNSTYLAEDFSDPDVIAFYGIISDLAETLSEARPDIAVSFGETPRATKIMFAIGLISVIVSLGLIALAVATNVPQQNLINGSIAFGILLLFGLQICWSSNPWRAPEMLIWDELGALVRAR